MGGTFVSVIIFAVCVKIYLTQDALEVMSASAAAHPFAHLKPFTMDDFSNPPVVEPKNCYRPFIECLKKVKARRSVCALKKDHGLITMASECDVHFQNCLAHTEDDVIFGTSSNEDIFYYNGKDHNCLHYFKNTKNLTQASILYLQGWLKDETGNEITFTETVTE